MTADPREMLVKSFPGVCTRVARDAKTLLMRLRRLQAAAATHELDEEYRRGVADAIALTEDLDASIGAFDGWLLEAGKALGDPEPVQLPAEDVACADAEETRA
jgi:hypothetical protein